VAPKIRREDRKGFVEAMGVTITAVNGSEGRGALPRHAVSGPGREDAPCADCCVTAMMAVSSRVLVVDDEAAIHRFLRASLTAQGYLVAEADSGSSMLEHVRHDPVDVLVLDPRLPDADGLDIVERLRKESSTLPIVILSSRTDEFAKVAPLDLGADDYLTSPSGSTNCWRASGPLCVTDGDSSKTRASSSVATLLSTSGAASSSCARPRSS
jgi:CheY-like chemotaxis protein